MISNKVTMQQLLKALSHIKFNEITIKGDKFTAVYTSLNLKVVVEYLQLIAFTPYIKATTYLNNAIVDTYTTVNLNEFVNYMNDVVDSTTVVDVKDKEIERLKQRIVELEQLLKLSNVRYMVGTAPVNERITLDELISKVNTVNKPIVFGSSIDDDLIRQLKIGKPKYGYYRSANL